MRTLQIVPEDVVIQNEIRYSELKKIKLAMDHSTVEMNLADEEQREAHKFYTQGFYTWVCHQIEAIENGS